MIFFSYRTFLQLYGLAVHTIITDQHFFIEDVASVWDFIRSINHIQWQMVCLRDQFSYCSRILLVHHTSCIICRQWHYLISMDNAIVFWLWYHPSHDLSVTEINLKTAVDQHFNDLTTSVVFWKVIFSNSSVNFSNFTCNRRNMLI